MSRARHDFDLHGVVGVRLLDATPADVAAVARQLGLPGTVLEREPDLTIRFVDVATRAPLTHVGVGDTGFNHDGFFLLRRHGGRVAKTRLPFEALGRSPELVCERPVAAVPHLLSIVNLVLLTKGVLPLHASAFVADSLGVLVTGWSKGGKTESLLAAMQRGASYVGDEWVHLTRDGAMLGLSEPIRLWGWQLDQLPALRHARSRPDRARLSAWRAVEVATRTAAATGLPGAELAGRLHPLAGRQANLRVPPRELFGADRVVPEARLDSVVLVLSHSSDEITTRRAGATEVSARMSASLVEERAAFLSHYRQFRFAFPDLSSPVLDSAPRLEAGLLAEHFDHRPCVAVAHPHPCNIAALGEAVRAAARELAGSRMSEPQAAS